MSDQLLLIDCRKTCLRCRESMAEEEFSKDVRRRDGLSPWCRACWKDYMARYGPHYWRDKSARYRERGGDRVRSMERRRRLAVYGLTPEHYDELVHAQDGVCAICQRAPRKGVLSVDHDHRTGKVRGLLCGQCNMAIGAFTDSPPIMARAIEYLRRAV